MASGAMEKDIELVAFLLLQQILLLLLYG